MTYKAGDGGALEGIQGKRVRLGLLARPLGVVDIACKGPTSREPGHVGGEAGRHQ